MDIVVVDGHDLPNPEHQAMLAALYSRSPTSVKVHMEQVRVKGADAFMSKWYVNYGHKSIGDCGTATAFIENVSMLAAKAVQDTPLYNGQEASTRYLDFSNRPVVNPAGTEEGTSIQRDWIALYSAVLERLIPHFQERFPRLPEQKESVWKGAINAKAFDVARGFLPAGCTTYVAWHTNLRQAHDHLSQMRHNPCAEIREVAERTHEGFLKRYPSSFGHKRYEATEAYLAKSVARFAFSPGEPTADFVYESHLDIDALMEHEDLLTTRPPKTELHQRFRQYGEIEFRFMLDFGSYRDLQRQRSCVQEMPLLTMCYGLHPWYLEQLPSDVRKLVEDAVQGLEDRIEALDVSYAERQYYVAMGYQNPTKITCPLPSAVYIAELRSGTTVHPTVRKIGQQIGEALLEIVPGIALHHDMSESEWDIKRGTQTITERGL